MHTVLASSNRRGPVVFVIQNISFALPFGVAYLAGELKRRGHRVIILFRPVSPHAYPNLVAQIMQLKPLYLGFSGLFPDIYFTHKLVQLLNAAGRNFPIVVGGQMLTPTPVMTLSITGAEYGGVGEGEISLSMLTAVLQAGEDPAKVPGFVIRDDMQFTSTGEAPFYKDLSKLPEIPYELFPSEKWLNIGRFYATMHQAHWRYNDRVVSIHGGRGCPYHCNFCYHHSAPRYRSVDSMFEELERMVVTYDANMGYFGDDLVLASPRRGQDFVEHLERMSRKIDYSVSCRFDILDRMDDGLLQQMKQTGCRIMGIGVESGSQAVLDRMDKRITVDQIRRGFTRLKKVGILPTVSIMVGQVDETVAEVAESIALMRDVVRENNNVNFAFTIATPFPGSPMFTWCKEKGLVRDELDFFERFDPIGQFTRLTINASAMTDEELWQQYTTIQQVYTEEKAQGEGRAMKMIEGARRKLVHMDTVYRPRAQRYAQSSRFDVMKGYDATYSALHRVTDCLRLKTRGL